MFLTADELADLTGLKRPKAQAAWLRSRGWPVEVDARGRPRLLRSVATLLMLTDKRAGWRTAIRQTLLKVSQRSRSRLKILPYV